MENALFGEGKTILVVAAHPDDEVLGCGGTIARLAKTNAVDVLILGTGFAARTDGTTSVTTEVDALQRMAERAKKVLGYRNLYFENLPDNRFDSVALLDVVKLVEKHKKAIQPDVIFTHHRTCLNVDHQMTFRAVLTATRPMQGEPCTELYSFEIASSSEWNFPEPFRPDTFVDVTEVMAQKVNALIAYKEELRDFPHPRSITGIETLAHTRGMAVGLMTAEAFQTVRRVL